MRFYDLLVKKAGFAGKLLLNDVPVEVWHTAEADSSATVANSWIEGRTNRVRFEIDWPKDLQSFRPQILASVKSTAERRGRTADQPEIAAFHWPANPAAVVPGMDVEFTFTADEPPPSELWGSLRPLSLDNQVRADVMGVLSSLHSALGARDMERTAALLNFKAIDTYRVMYYSAQEGLQGLREFYDLFFSDPAFAMEPLDPEKVEFHLVAGNRIVWATSPDFEPVLQSVKAAQLRLMLAVYLAPLQGRWTIVR